MVLVIAVIIKFYQLRLIKTTCNAINKFMVTTIYNALIFFQRI